jgi:hypothetical protein
MLTIDGEKVRVAAADCSEWRVYDVEYGGRLGPHRYRTHRPPHATAAYRWFIGADGPARVTASTQASRGSSTPWL